MNQSIVDFFFPHFVVVACGKVRDNSSTSSSSSYFTSNQNEFPEFPERRNWGTWAASVRDDVTAPSIGIGNVATRIIIQINKQIAAEDETIIRNWRWCHQLEFISFLFSFSLSLSLSSPPPSLSNEKIRFIYVLLFHFLPFLFPSLPPSLPPSIPPHFCLIFLVVFYSLSRSVECDYEIYSDSTNKQRGAPRKSNWNQEKKNKKKK